MYQLLARFDVRLDKDETDSVGDLRYSWRKLLQTSNEVNSSLAELQTGFKRELVANVKQFVLDVQHFRNEFEAAGPMVTGLPPMEAVERLRKFQRLYEAKQTKYEVRRERAEQSHSSAPSAPPAPSALASAGRSQ